MFLKISAELNTMLAWRLPKNASHWSCLWHLGVFNIIAFSYSPENGLSRKLVMHNLVLILMHQ